MIRMTTFLCLLISSIFLFSVQAWAAPIDPATPIVGDLAAGWYYEDTDGDGGTYDIDYISGYTDFANETLVFDIYTVGAYTVPTGINELSDSWAISLDLNNDGVMDAQAGGTWLNLDPAYSTFGWVDFASNGLANNQVLAYSDHVSISAGLEAADWAGIDATGFNFNFNAFDDGVSLSESPTQVLYVAPEPGSILLLGSGLGFLMMLRKKVRK